MPNIELLRQLKSQFKDKKITLVAVSKTKPIKDILSIYEAGHKVFGENRVQELVEKHEQLPKDIQWHLIGHLQTNKVKYIAPFIHLIHAVDSEKLLKTINKEAKKNNRVISCLLQMHIAREDTKYGLDEQMLFTILDNIKQKAYENVAICGLMGMATFTDNHTQVQSEFTYLKKLFDTVKNQYFANTDAFNTLSMGMSGDYELAVNCGSNMVRIGSLLFGSRH